MVARVLQVSRSVIDGGFDYHVEIARAISHRGAQILSVFQRGLMPEGRSSEFPGRVVCLDAQRRRRYKHVPIFALRLWREVQRKPIDLALCHHLTPARAVDLLVRGGRVRRPHLIVHDYDYFDPADRDGRSRGRFLRSILKRGWRVIGVSQAICDNVRAQVPEVPAAACLTIRNGIDVDGLEAALVSRQSARKTLGLTAESFVFGTIGRLVPFKAHEDLLEAFASVHAQMPDSRLVIIGRGPLQGHLEQRVRALGLEGSALVHGFLDQAARHLRAFDVFVLPSRHEPFGLVLPEAMTARLPVIACDSGGPREILPPEQTLVATGDRRALAQRLLELFRASPAERAALAESAYQRVREHFRIEAYRAAYAALLDGERR
jgi:glycosyltransferase involved in cell wall biosynthesis